MTLIVDASICVKWFIDEDRADDARLIADDPNLLAPTFVLLETYHVVWKRSRRQELLQAQAANVLMLQRVISRFEPDQNLVNLAADLANSHHHAIYDCLYIALAALQHAPLITADEKQFTIARRANVAARLL
jgi:predicted nucleic acid-binding protein